MKRSKITLSTGELREVIVGLMYAVDNCCDHHFPYTAKSFTKLSIELLSRAGFSSFSELCSND